MRLRRTQIGMLVMIAAAALLAACPAPSASDGDAGDASLDHATRVVSDASADGADAATDPATLLAHGAQLYGRYCAFCHSELGQGYKADEAPAIGNPDFLATASNDYLRKAILDGRPGTTMSAWSITRGGPLSVTDAESILTYMRSWRRPDPIADTSPDAGTGDAANGQKLYAANCLRCHGKEGRDGKYNQVTNPEFLTAADDSFLRITIEHGRRGTPMAGFDKQLGPQGVSDLVAALRGWQKPADLVPELPPKPGALQNIVIHPNGPQPAFEVGASFVPVDTVKREFDRGASMILIDARPPADYARMHIAGAISVPFYQVADYAKQLPKDRAIITYCACPHAESGQVRDALKGLEYKRVAVLDEGLYAWRDRGYPVRGGPKP